MVKCPLVGLASSVPRKLPRTLKEDFGRLLASEAHVFSPVFPFFLLTSMANSSEPSFRSCSATRPREHPQVSGNGCHDGAEMALTRWGDATGDEAAGRLGDPREGGPGALTKDGSSVSGGLQGCRGRVGHHFFMRSTRILFFASSLCQNFLHPAGVFIFYGVCMHACMD